MPTTQMSITATKVSVSISDRNAPRRDAEDAGRCNEKKPKGLTSFDVGCERDRLVDDGANSSESRLQHSWRQSKSQYARRRHRRDHQGDLTDGDEYLKAAMLGWGIEFLQVFLLVSDDTADAQVTH
ncbi:hypothetical protein EDD18DRAFT_1364680 [Armillaria luteobubalina]|uniref:Uncharacterized protein n=1 Tax=Armillaria luteobubalina TaxID=153913 RepID=A0AA39P6R7_9AGAR|nr:hypothetical protein EDD18DRAFT_1364680 [Armillaria luteobubalina]